MDIKDFEGLTKYKIIIPTIYVLSWICMLLGPPLFDVTYERICIFFLFYVDVKVLVLFVTMIIVTIKSNRIFKRILNKLPPSESSNQDHLDVSQ